MAWIEIHQHLKEHRKTRKFKNIMGITRAQAIGHLVMLWLWGIDNTDDHGEILDADQNDIADACDYHGDDHQMISALIESGFLEKDEADGKLFIHDFEDYIGKLKAQKKKHREAQQKYADKLKSNPNDSCTDNQADSQGDGHKIANNTLHSHSPSHSPSQEELFTAAVIVLSSEENEFISELQKVNGYPLDKVKDLEMYKVLQDRYPQLDLVAAIKDWVVLKLDHPLEKGQNPRSQINTSMKKNVEWGKNLKLSNKPNGILKGEGPGPRRDDM